MNASATIDRVAKIIAEHCGIDPVLHVKPESKLLEFDGLGLDSLDIVEIAMALEDEFRIEVPDQDVEKWKTVQDMVNDVDRIRALPGYGF